MALSKKITTGGVPLSYHRVQDVGVVTNSYAQVTVASYYSATARQEEEDAEAARAEQVSCWAEGDPDPIEVPDNVARRWTLVTDGPANDMTVDRAYEWLLARPEFQGAKAV